MANYNYQFDPDYTIEGRHYAHPAISWGAVIGGALLAVAIGLTLALFGVAIGATAFNPYAATPRGDHALSVGGGLYLAFSQLVALQIGAFIAARTARYPDLHGGALTGALVWALAVVLVAFAAGFGLSLGSASLLARGTQVSLSLAEAARDAGDPAEADRIANAAAVAAWWGFTSFALGGAGAVAGGWLGAHHPAWEGRPRLEHRAVYQSPGK
ncbi:MAG TPA: hypothetical protein VG841_15295 [Caulobacterales bacterium]|nr:hypothetical protein [Caulobacterales bacterium]